MATSVVMPALELAQETGRLLAWLKKQGDAVSKGEPLLEIETDKAVVEIEAPADGVLAGVTAKVGDVIPVGRTIAWLVRPGEVPPPDEDRSSAAQPASPRQLVTPAPTAAGAAEPPLRGALLASPKARRLAREHNINLDQVRGSGPDGEVLGSDVLALVGGGGARKPVEAIGTVWRLMAERTTRSWTTVPHFFVTREVDAGPLIDARTRAREAGVTYTDFLIVLVARVLQRHPRINGSWTGDAIRLNDEIKIGLATAVDDGVVVTVFDNAASSSVEAIATERRQLVDRARLGLTSPSDVIGATFTISNLGTHDVDSFTAIINPPQAAILAVGAIVDRVVAVAGRPAVRPTITLTLSCDHRVVDGARAAAFMTDVADAIGDPGGWLR